MGRILLLMVVLAVFEVGVDGGCVESGLVG